MGNDFQFRISPQRAAELASEQAVCEAQTFSVVGTRREASDTTGSCRTFAFL